MEKKPCRGANKNYSYLNLWLKSTMCCFNHTLIRQKIAAAQPIRRSGSPGFSPTTRLAGRGRCSPLLKQCYSGLKVLWVAGNVTQGVQSSFKNKKQLFVSAVRAVHSPYAPRPKLMLIPSTICILWIVIAGVDGSTLAMVILISSGGLWEQLHWFSFSKSQVSY